ncbi:MAG: hypothetical protein WC374_03550 [Phycisphaerae bacterium]|jgi:hypothetical protein
MGENLKQRYIRWQDYRIKQLSFAINLFIGLAVASLGFVINIKLSEKSIDSLSLVIILWAVSILFGVISTIVRLIDFCYTARKIKDKNKFNTFMAKRCGCVTWVTFIFQVVAYMIGAGFFIVEILRYNG